MSSARPRVMCCCGESSDRPGPKRTQRTWTPLRRLALLNKHIMLLIRCTSGTSVGHNASALTLAEIILPPPSARQSPRSPGPKVTSALAITEAAPTGTAAATAVEVYGSPLPPRGIPSQTPSRPPNVSWQGYGDVGRQAGQIGDRHHAAHHHVARRQDIPDCGGYF